ncbi:hypothetical protein NFI96_004636 [Prochilodus magdalenae]|nr:hypothetical protein NFI96_004636 [Prochilodus magdalenae]
MDYSLDLYTYRVSCMVSGAAGVDSGWRLELKARRVTLYSAVVTFGPFTERKGVLGEGALQIERSEETDQGKYECVASNSQGVRYSSPANLYVRAIPKQTLPPERTRSNVGGADVAAQWCRWDMPQTASRCPLQLAPLWPSPWL